MIGYAEYVIRYINPSIVQLDSPENIFGLLFECNEYVFIWL